MNKFSIKDIENLTGIKAHTIRIWEQRYGVLQPKRTPTNIRYYDANDLKLALRISLLNNFGYKISRIHQMGEHEMATLLQKINDADFRLHLLVNEMLEDTLAMDIDSFESLIDMYLKKHGMEQTIELLIFHFLEKIGLMWLTDHIFPAQEHLISNVIYRKLAAAIEQLPKHKATGNEPMVLLYLPEGEIHDIALLYVNYLLLKHGKKTIYLGANTPFTEVKFAYDHFRPKYVYIHLTSVAGEFDGNKYLQKISHAFEGSQNFVSGGMLKAKKYACPQNVTFLHSLSEVKTALLRI